MTLKKCKKLNNKGMSIVELIIAIMIIAIAGTAILHCIVTSVNINRKAREKQTVTTAAQSVMEGFKAYNIESIVRQFDPTQADTMKVVINPVAGTAVVSQDPGNGKYVFAMHNYECDGETYDALIKVNPLSTIDASYSGELDYVTAEGINPYMDAIYVPQSVDASADQEAYVQIMDEVADALNAAETYQRGSSTQWWYSLDGDLTKLSTARPGESAVPKKIDKSKVKITKTTDVTASTDGTGTTKVTVKIKYDYKVNAHPYREAAGTGYNNKNLNLTGSVTVSTDREIYNNSATKADGAALDSIYFFYYPAFAKEEAGYVDKEVLNFTTNGTGQKLYIYKQMNPTFTDIQNSTYEAYGPYSPYVYTYMVNPGGVSHKQDDAFEIFWNLCGKVAKPEDTGYSFRLNDATLSSSSTGYHRCESHAATTSTMQVSEYLNFAVDVEIYKSSTDISTVGTTDLLYTLNGSKFD